MQWGIKNTLTIPHYTPVRELESVSSLPTLIFQHLTHSKMKDSDVDGITSRQYAEVRC